LPITRNYSSGIELSCELEEASLHPKFVALGIQFSHLGKRGFEVLHDPAFDALSVLAVEHLV